MKDVKNVFCQKKGKYKGQFWKVYHMEVKSSVFVSSVVASYGFPSLVSYLLLFEVTQRVEIPPIKPQHKP